MKKLIKYTFVALLAVLGSGCSDYLDVVPDKTQEISLLFDRKESAYRALATCYHYIPLYANGYNEIGASEETIMRLNRATPGKNLVMGELTADNMILSYWTGMGNWDPYMVNSIFQPMRICNEFLENINKVPDMTMSEKSRWSAEVKYLKAYYHFLLFQQYGAIPVMRENTPIDATGEALHVKREPVDSVVNYMVNQIDEAMNYLPINVTNANEIGRIDQTIALALKAKILLYAASPLFSNNATYASLANKDGELLWPAIDDEKAKEKWIRAANALEAAITHAEQNAGAKLFYYEDEYMEADVQYAQTDDRIQYMYNYQYATVENWNDEIIWADPRSMTYTEWMHVQKSFNLAHKDASETGHAWQWQGATINVAELFYTKNGLPIDEDPDFDYDNRFELITIPAEDAAIAIEGEQTVKLHLNREPRFYASIGFDRSRVRAYGELYDLKIRMGDDNGAQSETDDTNVNPSGYFVRKIVHPDSEGAQSTIVYYTWPIFRLNELYLSYAEALNEAYGTAEQEKVLNLLNEIRKRSGVPSVEVAWAKAVKNPDLYKTQAGMRTIIQQERMCELAFEGHRFHDARRWLMADKWFNVKIRIWDVYKSSAEDFYKETELSDMLHVFTTRNYLWPIPTEELVNNPNLVQNPGY